MPEREVGKAVIYLDNAASSFPKPPEVTEAVSEALRLYAANPGRSGHSLALRAMEKVYETRYALGKLLGCPTERVIFTHNATAAMNLCLFGYAERFPGCGIVSTVLEHNCVLRPLYALRRMGHPVRIVPPERDGIIDPCRLLAAADRRTRILVVTCASNVTGSLQPVREICELAAKRGLIVVADGAQTVGCTAQTLPALGCDALVFTGHKALLGPQGTGGVCFRENAPLPLPREFGGTGSASDAHTMPEEVPERFEAGTMNMVGLAGLREGIRIVREEGAENIARRETELCRLFEERIAGLPGIRILGRGTPRTGIVAFTLSGAESGLVADALDADHGIAVRSGLHCAPLAHRFWDTLQTGAVRISVSRSTTREEILTAAAAVREIADCCHSEDG